MTKTIHARDYEDVLKICRELSLSGQADLFRGQTVDWPRLIPSLFRLSGDKREAADAEIKRFAEWAHGVPQMHPYHSNDDAVTAIAQHYGIATSFLDLTSDPQTALTFAKSAPATFNGDAVIYCFLENDLRNLDGVNLVRISVENLWRLEAQHGLFLNYLTEGAVEVVKSRAVKILLPRIELTEADTSRLYPARKSALETVLDQWFYKRDIEGAMDLITPHMKYQFAVRRQTYPGLFDWRKVPELEPQWVGGDPRWVLPPVESVQITGLPLHVKVRLPVSDPLRDAKYLREIFLPVIFEALATRRLLNWDLELAGVGKRYSKSITQIANWVWDGMRILPYQIDELATAMANTLTMLAHTAKRTKHSSDIPNILFGETQVIDVAPVGGHIESGSVSKFALNVAKTYANGRGFTNYGIKKLLEAPETLSDFITDPWLLFDFMKFKKIFIEQFVPTAINGFWSSDIEHHKGKLGSMWSVPFNPALLGYVSNFEYRFTSPLAMERDVEHLVLLNHDMDKSDIFEVFLYCMPQIIAGDGPFLLRLHGYADDTRPIWEIPRAVQQAKWVAEIGGISVLEVVPSVSRASENDAFSSTALGAFEVWLISKGLLKDVMGKSLQEIKPTWDQFWQDLLLSNEKMDRAYEEAINREADPDP